MSMSVVPFLVCLVVALLVLLPFGALCIWASYRLGRRLRLTDQTLTLVLGIGVFSLPFMIAFGVTLEILRHLLHLPNDGQYAVGGIAVGGWMGAGSARLQNLKEQTSGQ